MSQRRSRWFDASIPFALTFVFLLFTGCGPGPEVGPDGRLVGGSCGSDRDCAPESECLRGGDFPGGTCAVHCGDGQGCPRGTRCIDEQGGYCLMACGRDSHCRGGYECDERDSDRSRDRFFVCIDD